MSSAIHSNMFLDFILRFRGSGPGGLLWTRGPHCSQSLHCLLTLRLFPPTLQLPVTSCRVSITGNHGFRTTAPATVCRRHWRRPELRLGGQEGASPCCHFRWPSGLRRLSLPPSQAFGGQIPRCVSQRDTCLDVQFSCVPRQLGSFCSSISSYWGLGWTLR